MKVIPKLNRPSRVELIQALRNSDSRKNLIQPVHHVHLPTMNIHQTMRHSSGDFIRPQVMMLPGIHPNSEFNTEKVFHKQVNLSEAFSMMKEILKEEEEIQPLTFWQKVRKFFTRKH